MSALLRKPWARALGAAGVAGVIAATTSLPASAEPSAEPSVASASASVEHVLLVSVDGMHQSDLARYVAAHPASALGQVVGGGREFTRARTPFPSDSFPGMVGQVTGGDPRVTGVYYDDSYNRVLLPAGTTTCAGVKPGAEVTYFEAADRNPHSLDAGQGLPNLPAGILGMTGNPTTLIDPAQ